MRKAFFMRPAVGRRVAWSLSGFLCAGHSMTNRSMYANQQEDDEGGPGRSGGDAVDPEGTH
jgi:hypothetical protein